MTEMRDEPVSGDGAVPHRRIDSTDAAPSTQPVLPGMVAGSAFGKAIRMRSTGGSGSLRRRRRRLSERAAQTGCSTTFPPASSAGLRRDHSGQLHASVAPETDFVQVDERVKPFDNPSVRRALNLAIDRTRVVAYYGNAARPACRFLPPGVPGFRPDCPYRFDLARAKSLVRAAHATGDRVVLIGFTDDSTIHRPLDRYLASVLRQMGLEPKIEWTSHVQRSPTRNVPASFRWGGTRTIRLRRTFSASSSRAVVRSTTGRSVTRDSTGSFGLLPPPRRSTRDASPRCGPLRIGGPSMQARWRRSRTQRSSTSPRHASGVTSTTCSGASLPTRCSCADDAYMA